MRNESSWQPSKYVYRRGRLRGSRNKREVAAGSRLVADLNARYYDPLIQEHARGRLLDLGCGKAPLYAVYRHRVTSIVCADWSKSRHGAEHVDIYCDAGRPLPFRDGVFDTVLASDLLEHVYDPRALLAEIARVLAPSGRLIMNTPFIYWLHEIPHDYQRLTPFALDRMMRDARLRVASITSCGGAPQVLADITAKCLARLPLLGQPLAVAVQTMVATFAPISPDTSFPLSHFAVAEKPAEAACDR